MKTKTQTSFLGIPVDGDITRGDKRTPQKDLSELEPLMRAVLADEYIHSFGWTQYTPYFNDGDPCVFSVGEPWFRTVDDVKDKTSESEDDEDEDYERENDDSFSVGYGEHPTLGKREYEYVGDWPDRVKVMGAYVGGHEASYDRCLALHDAIDSGAFEDVLLEAFGDHARVTVRASGISVDEYSHD